MIGVAPAGEHTSRIGGVHPCSSSSIGSARTGPPSAGCPRPPSFTASTPASKGSCWRTTGRSRSSPTWSTRSTRTSRSPTCGPSRRRKPCPSRSTPWSRSSTPSPASAYSELAAAAQRISGKIFSELLHKRHFEDTSFVLPIERLSLENASEVGGKAANLGEVCNRANLPVPPGFAITAYGYQLFLDYNELSELIERKLKTARHQRHRRAHGREPGDPEPHHGRGPAGRPRELHPAGRPRPARDGRRRTSSWRCAAARRARTPRRASPASTRPCST